MAGETPIDLPVEQPPAARHYGLLCVMMLLVMTALLAERVPEVWCALPLLFGAVLLLVQWRDAPALVLLFVAWLVASEGQFGEPRDVPHDLLLHEFHVFAGQSRPLPVFDDFLLAGAFLLYAASYYRYVGFARNLFPLDTRQRPYGGLALGERRRQLEEPQRRTAETVTMKEFGLLAVGVPVWIGGAALLWGWLMDDQPQDYAFDQVFAAALKLLYLFGVPLLLFRASIAYANQVRAHPAEHVIYLQDQLWRETRREQGRVNRWLTWARLRAQRREEKT
jgi:hypothetical protein